MHLNIKNHEAHRMAKELAELTGESMTEAVLHALEKRLTEEQERAKRRKNREGMAERLMAIGREAASLPVFDDRHPDDMLYDEFGAPKPRDDR